MSPTGIYQIGSLSKTLSHAYLKTVFDLYMYKVNLSTQEVNLDCKKKSPIYNQYQIELRLLIEYLM